MCWLHLLILGAISNTLLNLAGLAVFLWPLIGTQRQDRHILGDQVGKVAKANFSSFLCCTISTLGAQLSGIILGKDPEVVLKVVNSLALLAATNNAVAINIAYSDHGELLIAGQHAVHFVLTKLFCCLRFDCCTSGRQRKKSQVFCSIIDVEKGPSKECEVEPAPAPADNARRASAIGLLALAMREELAMIGEEDTSSSSATGEQ